MLSLLMEKAFKQNVSKTELLVFPLSPAVNHNFTVQISLSLLYSSLLSPSAGHLTTGGMSYPAPYGLLTHLHLTTQLHFNPSNL